MIEDGYSREGIGPRTQADIRLFVKTQVKLGLPDIVENWLSQTGYDEQEATQIMAQAWEQRVINLQKILPPLPDLQQEQSKTFTFDDPLDRWHHEQLQEASYQLTRQTNYLKELQSRDQPEPPIELIIRQTSDLMASYISSGTIYQAAA